MYRWYQTSSATTDYYRRQDAIRNIRYYYSHVVNGVSVSTAGRGSTVKLKVTDIAFYLSSFPFPFLNPTPSLSAMGLRHCG